ncbi:MAG: cobaltochelatase subunit CobN [Methanolobus sp.]|nr:cobaltochelatase subunit CobN [Methanolobus sp.]
MQERRILTLLISVLLLLSLTTSVSAGENNYYLVANTTSGPDGLFVFEDIPDGDYTLIAVNWSSQKMVWYTGLKNFTLKGTDLADQNIKVNSTAGIDDKFIFGLLNRSSVSGMTYVMKTDYPRESTIVLLDQQTKELIAHTSSDATGNYLFSDIPDGDYSIVAVNCSTDKELWYRGITNVTLKGEDLTEQNIKVSSSTDIDENFILGLLNRSSVSGMTYVMKTDYPRESTIVLLDQQTKELIAHTSSDATGNYLFSDIPDGDYSIVAVNCSTDKELWYRGITNVTLKGEDLTEQNIKVSSSTDIDENFILGLLNRSSVSGMTYVMKTDYPRESTVVLLKDKKIGDFIELPPVPDDSEDDNGSTDPQEPPSSGTGDETNVSFGTSYEFFLSTSSDGLGDFLFENIPNGEYRILAVNWSTAMGGMWLTNVTDVTVVNGMAVENMSLTMRSNADIDHDAIRTLMNETIIAGKTVGKKSDIKISDIVLKNQYGEFVASTTANNDGEFMFTGIRNGQYTISAVNWSTAMGGMWLTNVTEVTVVNGLPVENMSLTMRSNAEIDHDAIRTLMNETFIAGKTVGKKSDNKVSDIVLKNQYGEFVSSTTANNDGEFMFAGIRNGQYTVSAVNWSTAMGGMWLTNVTEVTVVNGLPVENMSLTMRSNADIDHDAIFAMLQRTEISGETLGKKGDSKVSDIVLMKKRLIPTSMSNSPHLNISFVTGYSSYENELASVAERINADTDLNITFNYYVTTKLPENIDLSQEDIIYIVMVTQSAAILENTIQDAIDNGAIVVGSNTYLPESDYDLPDGFADLTEFKKYLSNYWSGGATDDANFDNLIFYLAQTFYDHYDLAVEEPSGLESAIYHPSMVTTATECFTGDAQEYFEWYAAKTEGHVFDENAPTVGITFYKSYYPDDMDPIDKLIAGFEEKGVNVIACYGNADNYLDGYFNYSTHTKVDAVVSFHYRGNYFDIEGLGVPVMNAILNGYMNTSQWIETSTPLPVTNMLRIYGPETEGLIDPIMIGAKETVRMDNNTVEKYIAHQGQVEWLVDRTMAQANLGIKDEASKKVAVIYYNHGGGKDNIGASYLEVAPSIVNLLEGMADAGYDVDGSLIPNKTELVDLMVYQGRNVGTWAPGELDALVRTGKIVLLPESTYLAWFNELPQQRKNEVIDMWGEAPGKIMVHTEDSGDRFIVIPQISLSDNVILAPQPSRGWFENYETLYHDTELPPNHQYIAFYLWMQHEFDADVMVNMGRHGTVEWLPGKDFCLLSDEWPALMVGDIPVIYPYVMDGMGEGMQAKRRGNAVVIDHLIPPVISAGLYGNYSTLSSEITSYQTSLAEDENLKQAHLQDIIDLSVELGLDEHVNMSLADSNETVDEFLDELNDLLYELRSLSMPYGLHILGEAPQDQALVGMVNSMLGSGFAEQVAAYNNSDSAHYDLLSKVLLEEEDITDAQVQILGTTSTDIEIYLNTAMDHAQMLSEAGNEIEQVLKAMNGEYIRPNLGGDPVMRPDTLPSGSNFYAFDEQLIPTKQAWEQGKALVDQWLTEYVATNGEYPTRAGYILWAGESTRHEGIMESQLLYMMGIEPVWNSANGKVENVKIIDSSELGRPRIDVIVQISGLYRDTFPMKVQLIDKAVRLAYEQEETDLYDNYVAQNTDALQAVLNETIEDDELSRDIALFRIFGPADGNYGTGMANAASASDTWDNNTELAEFYIRRMSYVYGQNIWGQTIAEYVRQQTGRVVDIDNTVVFENNLNDTHAIFHSRSSNTYGSLDIDDFYQYMGGLYNAIKYASGTAPETYVVNLQDLSDLQIQTLQTYLANELYSRYFNPLWISGMQQHGFEGAREMESFIEHLWGWEALNPDLISDDVWNKVYENYFANAELSGWLKENNPYAYQAMTARMTETVRKGNWDASDTALRSLVAEQIKSVAESGATCCHHTCGNILNQQFVDGMAQALVDAGELSQDELDLYRQIMKAATTATETPADSSSSPASSSSRSGNTGKELSIVETSSGNQTYMDDTGAGSDLEQQASLRSPSQDNYIEGYEMTKESNVQETTTSGPSISGSDIIASLFVLVGVGAIYVGFVRRRKI